MSGTEKRPKSAHYHTGEDSRVRLGLADICDSCRDEVKHSDLHGTHSKAQLIEIQITGACYACKSCPSAFLCIHCYSNTDLVHVHKHPRSCFVEVSAESMQARG